MMRAMLTRLRRDEDGVAMMIAVVLSAVAATLVVTTITVGTHVDKASGYNRHWVQALTVAESGVEQAVAKIQGATGGYTGTFSGSTDQGTYAVTVTAASRNVYTVTSTGSVSTGKQLAARRKIQVQYAPPETFKAALFSYTSLSTTNGDSIYGDIWANQNVEINATTVHGNVTAATGYVETTNGAVVDKDIWAGGFNAAENRAIKIGNGTVGGNLKASVVNPPDPITCGNANPSLYSIEVDNGGVVSGGATTWGTVSGSGVVQGGLTTHTCTSAPATIPMPVLTYNSANYDSATLHEFGSTSASSATAIADFQAYASAHASDFYGTFYINQTAPVSQNTAVNLTGLTITRDTSIITNTPIFTNGTTSNTTDAIVLLASTYRPPVGSTCTTTNDNSECAIHLKNGFSSDGSTGLLAYAPYGAVSVKNNALQFGAIYADSMEVNNNQTITYDPRIDRIVGFGSVTLDRVRWLELNP